MHHHPYLEQPFPIPLNRFVHHHRAQAAVGSVPAAVRGTLKVVRVFEHHCILYQHNPNYLVAVAVDTLAAILDSRNYQEGLLHRLAGMGIPDADSHGSPVDYLGMLRQRRIGAG